MSSSETTGGAGNPETGATGASGAASTHGLWARLKAFVFRVEKDFAVLKLSLLSLLGTVIGLYFQSLSAYQDKVSAQSNADLTTATETFKATSNTLSTAIALQSLLFYDFVHAATPKTRDDKNALTTKNAQGLSNSYEDAAVDLRKSVNLMARKVQIDLDWSSDVARDPANVPSFGTDPISTSALGAVDFDCDKDMPKLAPGDHKFVSAKKMQDGNPLEVDWYSARHHVLTIAYCFDVTHKIWMETVRQWASQSSLDESDVDKFLSNKIDEKLQARLDAGVVRLNDFMSVAMHEIEGIRVKYRPTSFYCNFPGVSQVMGLFKSPNPCTPVRLRV
jgi:hypothetical protein